MTVVGTTEEGEVPCQPRGHLTCVMGRPLLATAQGQHKKTKTGRYRGKLHPFFWGRATALDKNRCHEEPSCYLPLPGVSRPRNTNLGKRSVHLPNTLLHPSLTNRVEAVTTQVLDNLKLFAQWASAVYCNSEKPVGQPIICDVGACDLISTSNTVIAATFKYRIPDSNISPWIN